MAHEFYSGVYARQPAWHGLGETVPDLMTTSDALRRSGAAKLIARQAPVFVQKDDGTFVPAPEWVAVVTDDDEYRALGIHGQGYVIENFLDAFTAIGDMFGDRPIWETMVLLRGGKIAAGCLRFPEFDRELIDGSHLKTYIAAYTSHDGSFGLTYTDTNIRAECANKLRQIDNERGNRRMGITHSSRLAERKAEAVRIMSYAQERVDRQAELAERLVHTKMNAKAVTAALDSLVPLPDDDGAARTRRMGVRAGILSALEAPDLENAKGTAWAFVQAVGDYTDHFASYRSSKSSTSGENRFISTVLKQGTLADKALALVAAR